MARQAPLAPEEIKPEHRDSFYYDRQELGPSGNRSVLKVERQCNFCENTYKVVVYNIRGDLARGREMRLGKCADCRGKYITKDGYIWIHKPEHPKAYNKRYVPEHVLVMEEKLGRYIDGATESIHHIDGDRANNKIENLQLRTRYHGAGQARVCGDCGSRNIKAVEI